VTKKIRASSPLLPQSSHESSSSSFSSSSSNPAKRMEDEHEKEDEDEPSHWVHGPNSSRMGSEAPPEPSEFSSSSFSKVAHPFKGLLRVGKRQRKPSKPRQGRKKNVRRLVRGIFFGRIWLNRLVLPSLTELISNPRRSCPTLERVRYFQALRRPFTAPFS